MKIIFLDIGGVIECVTPTAMTGTSRLPMFWECLQVSGALDNLQIIISDEVRLYFGLKDIIDFMDEIGPYIRGVTGENLGSRAEEVLEYVRRNRIPEWIAVNSYREDFETAGILDRLVYCRPEEGFSMEAGAELLEFLDGYPSPGTGHGRWSQ